jgi:NitT/TauT family transport system substrate-binding protein
LVQASVRGWQDYLKDPTSALALIKNLNPALDPELMQFSYEALRDGHFLDGDPQKQEAIGQFNAQRWTTMEQQLADLNLIPHPIDPTSAYTLQFLAK